MGLDLAAWVSRLSILHPTYLRISGVFGLGGGPEACQQEERTKISSNPEDFGCFAEGSCSLLLPPLQFLPPWAGGRSML